MLWVATKSIAMGLFFAGLCFAVIVLAACVIAVAVTPFLRGYYATWVDRFHESLVGVLAVLFIASWFIVPIVTLAVVLGAAPSALGNFVICCCGVGLGSLLVTYSRGPSPALLLSVSYPQP